MLHADIRLSPQTKIRAPGMMAVHYAPNTMAFLCPADTLIAMADDLCAKGQHIGILAFSAEIAEIPCLHILRLPADAELYEPALYSSLRALDNLELDTILIEQPPETEAWAAVNDRLNKATV
ncbi:Sua5 family C-terminal domain-containing protein [Methylomonas koyamae]|uniref:Sua5 family C-terminal domain-containing protein n=1 Tax=Methylomonas koyamae TaxID=702114 RepID=UPI002110081A|nr:Sua5 family C-terminal domain-containing protein [Methylomonas koyamae]